MFVAARWCLHFLVRWSEPLNQPKKNKQTPKREQQQTSSHMTVLVEEIGSMTVSVDSNVFVPRNAWSPWSDLIFLLSWQLQVR